MGINKVFHEIGRINTERSAFDLSFSHITTMDMGFLYPVMTKFTMPGDKWSFDVSAVARAIPMVYPAYVDIDLNIVNFFVPSRLLWDQFEEFITGNEKGEFNLKMPKLLAYEDPRSFEDCIYTRLGLLPPLFAKDSSKFSAYYNKLPNEIKPTVLPLRAYYFIWNEYFRDENLQEKVEFINMMRWPGVVTDGRGFMRVAWLKDYFTSALPFQQRGTSPSIPFEGVVNSDNLDLGARFGSISGTIASRSALKYSDVNNNARAFQLSKDANLPFSFNGTSLSNTNKEAYVETPDLSGRFPSIDNFTKK